MEDVVVFHAGTKRIGGGIFTSGGRVLNIAATGINVREAIDKSYGAIAKIRFENMYYRKDIGQRALLIES